ncbi:MAG TPA: ankyrin repeat domain-containing protein, partial [Waddliaceae bacterium]
ISSYSSTYLENHFQGMDSQNIKKFMIVFEEFAASLSDSERTTVLTNQIDLLEQSILQNDTSEFRPTLLSSIIKVSSEFAIKYMSIFRPSINLMSEGRLPLIEACKSQHVDLVQGLIKNGANPNLRDQLDRVAIGECVRSVDSMFPFPSKQNEEIFDTLLAANCDVNVPLDAVASSPFILCITKQIDQWSWKLLPLADVNYKNNLGMLALHQAVRYSSDDMVSELIKRGSDVNALALEGIVATRRVTPCHIGVACRKPKTVQLLLDAKADPHLRASNPMFRKGDEKEPYSAYLMAVDLNITECIEVIIKTCPPKPTDNELGFERGLCSTPFGRSRTLKHIAEAIGLKNQLNKVQLNGVNFYIEPFEEENMRRMVKEFFTNPEKDGFSLYLPIWEAVCKHAASNSDFSIIFSPEVTGSLCGKYNPETRNEIFIYHKSLRYNEVGEAIVHEMAHKCADMIYKNYSLAPANSHHPLYKAIEIDLTNLPNMNNNYAGFINKKFTLAPSYSEIQRPQEYIARIPQVIFALIHEFGLSGLSAKNVMKEYLPNLYEFYINDFIPECIKL